MLERHLGGESAGCVRMYIMCASTYALTSVHDNREKGAILQADTCTQGSKLVHRLSVYRQMPPSCAVPLRSP